MASGVARLNRICNSSVHARRQTTALGPAAGFLVHPMLEQATNVSKPARMGTRPCGAHRQRNDGSSQAIHSLGPPHVTKVSIPAALCIRPWTLY